LAAGGAVGVVGLGAGVAGEVVGDFGAEVVGDDGEECFEVGVVGCAGHGCSWVVPVVVAFTTPTLGVPARTPTGYAL
jgi:hypothetical protein